MCETVSIYPLPPWVTAHIVSSPPCPCRLCAGAGFVGEEPELREMQGFPQHHSWMVRARTATWVL